MKCVDVEKEIAMSPDAAFSEAVRAHLQQCPACRTYAAFALKVWRHPAPLPTAEISLETIRRRVRSRRRWLVARAAMIAVLIIGGAATMWQLRTPSVQGVGELQLSWDEWDVALGDLEHKIQTEGGLANWQIQLAESI